MKRSKFGYKKRGSELISKNMISSKSIPDGPLHIIDYYYSYNRNYKFLMNDEIIGLFRRSYDYYYKWIFRYESERTADKIIIKNVEIDEENSQFYFSLRNKIEECDVDYNKEYSYKYIYIYIGIIIQ